MTPSSDFWSPALPDAVVIARINEPLVRVVEKDEGVFGEQGKPGIDFLHRVLVHVAGVDEQHVDF